MPSDFQTLNPNYQPRASAHPAMTATLPPPAHHDAGRPMSTTLPRRQATGGIDRGPILLTAQLEHGHAVAVKVHGDLRHYRLAVPITVDGRNPLLVLIRIDRSKPHEAEVHRMGIDQHSWLGTARRHWD